MSASAEKLNFNNPDLIAEKDPYLLAQVQDNSLDFDARIEAYDKLHSSIFSQTKLDPIRTGKLLKASVSLRKDNKHQSTREVADTIYTDYLTPAELNRVKTECIKNRWKLEQNKQAMNAYGEFMTIEREYGEEAEEIYRALAKDFVFARVMDKYLSIAGGIPKFENRGPGIVLSALGEEVFQQTVKRAFFKKVKSLDAKGVVSPYYRGHFEATNSHDDQHGPLMNFKERFAELARTNGSMNEGEELPIFGKVAEIDGKWEIPVLMGTGEVGGPYGPASGTAYAMRLKEVIKNAPTSTDIQQAKLIRDIQLESTGGAVLASAGDGAKKFIQKFLSLQAVTNAPIVTAIHRNRWQIGMREEVVSAGDLEKIGNPEGISTVQIDGDNVDKLFMMTEFAAEKAVRDGGPSILVVDAPRFAPHSDAHGDAQTTEYIWNLHSTLSKFVATLPEHSPEKSVIEEFNKSSGGLIKETSDNQLLLLERLTTYLNTHQEKLPPEVILPILEVINKINDPYQSALQDLEQRGYITKGDIDVWIQEANSIFTEAINDVRVSERPNPQKVYKETRLPHPQIREVVTTKTQTLTGSEAFRILFQQFLSNEHAILVGTDINKGPAYHNGHFSIDGGYWGEARDLKASIWQKWPVEIDEEAVAQFIYGLGMFATKGLNQKDNLRVIYDGGYADYLRHAYPALAIHLKKLITSGGNISSLSTYLSFEGAVPGGGTTHVANAEALWNQTDAGDIVSISNTQNIFRVMPTVFRNPNPTMVLVDKLITQKRVEVPAGLTNLLPGEADIVFHTPEQIDDLQIISYGPAVNTVHEGLELYKNETPLENQKRIGLEDITWLRPFPENDTLKFVSEGLGPLLIVTQEQKSKAFANQIKATLENPESEFHQHIGAKDREIIILASLDKPVLCDKNLMDEIIPTPQKVKDKICQILENKRREQIQVNINGTNGIGHLPKYYFQT